ncbi:MAG: pyridoxal-dependent decarboxylase [Planctomycetota bacterium]
MDRSDIEPVLRAALDATLAYLAAVDGSPVGAAGDARGPSPLPSEGIGPAGALSELVERIAARGVASTGPRFFHYVVGGVTPSALAADWLASAVDQIAASVTASPVGVELEEIATRWLAELFDLDPRAWTGTLTTGATAANFTGLGAARQWWGERLGVDVAEEGLAGLPRPVVLAGGYVHASAVKALAMLGIGRRSLERFTADNRGAVDLEALSRRLDALDGAPAIVVATAGEVNAGRFDPIDELADLCDTHDAWLHVDGAFGLFARATPRTASLARGIERARSIASDAHKWLNVPYDCGFAFVRDRALLAKTFRMVADYLPGSGAVGTGPRVPANLGVECSRRARAFPVFATLLAHGRAGVRTLVERHLDLAERLARLVREADDLELVDEVHLNVVPFRFAPASVRRRDLDELNAELAQRVLDDGRVFVGSTRYRSVVCFRPAIANWRTGEADVDLLVEVMRQLGEELLRSRADVV